MNDLIFKGIWVIIGLIMLRFYAKRKHTVRSAILGMVSGGVSLVLLHYFGSYIGFSPQINMFNTMMSLVLGVPGVILITCVNMLL
ncbi:pro-sigmaK processing inhibitor BofA family protein [Porcipelethomonas sp.]|uniref:pro-sigmaK processing inhibitor BofA family protein n=1 Tax=Porcipelethomonas sp. TaxID=2981675 RepID=UPI003EF3AB10